MKKYILKKRKMNRGTALLFSLGILSLMIVMVMFFASKAKSHAHVSAIQLNSMEAKALARSLIPRIMLTVQKSPGFPDSNLFSSTYDSIVFEGINRDMQSADYDWLWKLEHGLNTFKVFGADEETGENGIYDPDNYSVKHLPLWQYIHDPNGRKETQESSKRDNEQSGKLLARFAFFTTPAQGRLNPNAMADHTNCHYISSKADIDNRSDIRNYCNICARRLGNSGAELFFTPLEEIDGNSEYNNMWNTLKKEGILNISNGLASTDNMTFRNALKKSGNETFQYWSDTAEFLRAMGKNSADESYLSTKTDVEEVFNVTSEYDREAFWDDEDGDGDQDDDEFHHRFNLRRTDWKDLTIEYLVREPEKYPRGIASQSPRHADFQKEVDKVENPDLNGNGNYDTGGIAWFRNWDDSKGWSDSETKRNQILANLLNYCSPANRPVVHTTDGNDDPSEWLDTPPSFTGLKRTLYLNEVFAGITISAKANEALADPENSYESVDYFVDYNLIAEAVDMYLNTLGDVNNSPKNTAESNLGTPNFGFYNAFFRGSISFQYKTGTGNDWATATFHFSKHGAGSGTSLNIYPQYWNDKIAGAPDVDPNPGSKDGGGYYAFLASSSVNNAGYDINKGITVNHSFTTPVLKSAFTPQVKDIKINIERVVLGRQRTKMDDDYTFPSDKLYKVQPKQTIYYELVDCANIGYEKTWNKTVDLKENGLQKQYFRAYVSSQTKGDPRMNLNADDWENKDEDNTFFGLEKVANTYWTNLLKKEDGPSLPLDGNRGTNSTLAGNPCRNTDRGDSGLERDWEQRNDPAWEYSRNKKTWAKREDHISTAFIRHATLEESDYVDGSQLRLSDKIPVEYPMESVWELGAIHRADHWQTLNIARNHKDYVKADEGKYGGKAFRELGGGEYKKGDAPILDQIKMTNDIQVLGKVNIERMTSPASKYFCFGALFLGMPYRVEGNYMRQGLLEGREAGANVDGNTGGYSGESQDRSPVNYYENEQLIGVDDGDYDFRKYTIALQNAVYGIGTNDWPGLINDKDYSFSRRSDLLVTETKYLLPIVCGPHYDRPTDALNEQIIGRTINLMKVEPGMRKITAILLVQMLQDSGQTYVAKDWNGDGTVKNSTIKDAEFKSSKFRSAQFQTGYRRFSDAEQQDEAMGDLFAKPSQTYDTQRLSEVIRGRQGIYNNGADAIVGEAKVKVEMTYDGATQRWTVTSYEYLDMD